MINKLFQVYLWFLKLTDAFEYKCRKFFFAGKFFITNTTIRKRALELLNINTAKLAVLIEKYFHGYSNYSFTNRKIMYQNLAQIESQFLEFAKSTTVSETDLLSKFGIRFSKDQINRLIYLKKIALFLKPNSKLQYESGVAFGELLKGSEEIKKFDCNQICTLYLHLYCLEYDANDLKIKLPKDHVCLHYEGIDIEATNGEFLIYNETPETYQITELLAVNLLDVSDLNYDTTPISPKAFYKMMSFAKRISKNPIIENNMQVAYKKMALFYIHKSDVKKAIFFIQKIANSEFQIEFYRQISELYLKKQKYKKALYYAKICKNPAQTQLIYSQMYNKLVEKVKDIQYLSEAKKYKSTYKKMLKLAKKLNDPNLIKNVKSTLKKL